MQTPPLLAHLPKEPNSYVPSPCCYPTHSRYPPPHSRYPPPRPASPPPPPTYHPTAWAAEQVLDSAHQPVIPSEEIMIQHPDDFGTVHRQSLEDRIPQPTSRWSTITGFPQRSDTVRRPLPQLHWLEQGFEAGGDQASTRSGALSDDEARGGPATSIHHNEEMRGSPLRSHPSVSSSESNGSRGTMDPDAFVSPGLGRTNRLSSHLPPSHSPHGHRPSHHSDERPPPVPRKNSRRYPSQPGRASSHSSTPRNIGSSSTELLQPQRTNESGFDSRQGPLDDMPAFVPEHDSDNEGLHRR
ncbi:hypothetical protein JCM5353_000485 [Sporobolomyces roseus]